MSVFSWSWGPPTWLPVGVLCHPATLCFPPNLVISNRCDPYLAEKSISQQSASVFQTRWVQSSHYKYSAPHEVKGHDSNLVILWEGLSEAEGGLPVVFWVLFLLRDDETLPFRRSEGFSAFFLWASLFGLLGAPRCSKSLFWNTAWNCRACKTKIRIRTRSSAAAGNTGPVRVLHWPARIYHRYQLHWSHYSHILICILCAGQFLWEKGLKPSLCKYFSGMAF